MGDATANHGRVFSKILSDIILRFSVLSDSDSVNKLL